ncbi:Hypothetical Protein FCC1311_080622 [Hondaea fermentalgiana]|uniref:Uncharacterized protein n=1 Tax=Hondaea fermentalgiana TaxID=2315210 RepID=A0A2R5GLT0_9STRA|nr:Hypothetical Protein FCC1311_080622 [Hondaea fermentalgiana]|eukprot:GBG31837.1 Hypothetical Protein FCC1311_080622 [Hondaea fermentalgiana]
MPKSTVQSSRVKSSVLSSTAGSTTESGDILGNHGASKKRQALVTKIKSAILGFGNAGFIITTYMCLLRAFAFQAGFLVESMSTSVQIAFTDDHLINTTMPNIALHVYRDGGSAGGLAWFPSSSDVNVIEVDSGMSHFVGVRTNESITFLASHACEGSTLGIEGILAFVCNLLPDNSTQDCKEVCLGLSDPYIHTASDSPSETSFEIQEFYRTKNSVGFGTTYTTEHVTAIEHIEGGIYNLELELRSEHRSNAQTKYYVPWQDIVTWYLMLNISLNVAGRLMTCPVLLNGVKIRSSRVLVKADLAGGLFTSPGRSLYMFLFTVICGCQNYLFLDAALYPHWFVSQFWVIAGVASTASVSLTMLLSRTDYRLFATGSMLFALATVARLLTMSTSQQNAQSEIRGLGQVLTMNCEIWEEGSSMPLQAFECNVADGMGMSGLEIFYKVFFEPLVVLFFLIVALECFVFISSTIKMTLVRSKKVNPSGSHMSGSGTSTSSKKYRVSAGSTIPGVSDYDKTVLLGNLGKSVFCRTWANPIWTILGKFTHASTFIEDDLVLYGPLLLKMNFFPIVVIAGLLVGKKRLVEIIIYFKAYVGVLSADSKLQSRKENGKQISEYVAEYDYDNMPTLLNGAPLQ